MLVLCGHSFLITMWIMFPQIKRTIETIHVYKDLDVRSTSLHIECIHNNHNHNHNHTYTYNIVLVILMIVGASLTIPDRQQKPIYLLHQYDEPSSVAKIEMSYKVGRQFKKSRMYIIQQLLRCHLSLCNLGSSVSSSCAKTLRLASDGRKKWPLRNVQWTSNWGDQKVTMKSERKWMNVCIYIYI